MSRPVLPWRSPLEYLPADSALVWIRRLPWYDRPVKAIFITPDAFDYTTTGPNGQTLYTESAIPVAAIHSWKFQFKADEQAFTAPP
jgi:hypothetical protein